MPETVATFGIAYLLGLSLIVVIGAQNAFVLRQGLRREHVFAVCLTCGFSDAALIVLGVTGFGAISEAVPWIEPVLKWGGAAFLIVYGGLNLLSAWRGSGGLSASDRPAASLTATLLTCLALTWLNPHVYLDTVVLVGSISAQYKPIWAFALGAAAASFTFFFALGYGARLLAPVFARPMAWRILDLGVAAIMFTIAAMLILG